MLLDSQQLLVEKKLKQLAQDLESQNSEGFFKKIISAKTALKSFYIYGDVGRGKSMLMKNFYNSLLKTTKIYFHFNGFMRLIHEALRDIRKEEKKFKDELIEAVKRVVKKNEVVCFDEFQVVDIADAMLLSRIFSYLFAQNVVTVFTSNSQPRNLYKNGLQREVFLEFVDKILLKNCEVLYLNSPTDYRSQYRHNLTKRYFISNKKNREEVQKIIATLTDEKKPKSSKIKVWGREIKVKKTFEMVVDNQILKQVQDDGALVQDDGALVQDDGACFENHSPQKLRHPELVSGSSPKTQSTLRHPELVSGSIAQTQKIAIFNFDQLCRVELAASDYQAICKNFDLIFLLKVPKLTSEDVNEARRFVLFIDEVYENKTALIVLAKTKSEKIYESGIGSETFARTVSRLNEIKSDQYWQESKVNFK